MAASPTTSRTPPARPSPDSATPATPGPTSPCGSASPGREPSNAGATPRPRHGHQQHPRQREPPVTDTGPVLALAPGTRTAPGTGANTGPFIHPQLTDERIFAGLHHAGYDAWLDHVWPAAACTRPVRLRGDIRHIDPATGELLRTVPTIGMPDGVIYKPCGNRRATVCPPAPRPTAATPTRSSAPGWSAARASPSRRHPPGRVRHLHRPVLRPGPHPARPPAHLHRQDPLHLPAAALPRPPRRRHAARTAGRCLLHPPRRDDPQLGQPLCPDCYDYAAQVVWNNHAGELWRRTSMPSNATCNQPPPRHRGLRPTHGPRRARQGRRVPGPRRRPLPRPAPPRRLRPRRPGPRSCPRRPGSPPPTWTTPSGTPPAPSPTAPRPTPPARTAG